MKIIFTMLLATALAIAGLVVSGPSAAQAQACNPAVQPC